MEYKLQAEPTQESCLKQFLMLSRVIREMLESNGEGDIEALMRERQLWLDQIQPPPVDERCLQLIQEIVDVEAEIQVMLVALRNDTQKMLAARFQSRQQLGGYAQGSPRELDIHRGVA